MGGFNGGAARVTAPSSRQAGDRATERVHGTATWPVQLELSPDPMSSARCFYFNGWIIFWSAVNFKSQYDAAIISAFQTLKWNVWSCFKDGFHWNVKNTSGKTFLLAHSQVLCQEVQNRALTVTCGMYTPRPACLYGWGLHRAPRPWMQMYWTINTLGGEQVTPQQNSLNAVLGNSLKSSLRPVGSTGWQGGSESDFLPEPARVALRAAWAFH